MARIKQNAIVSATAKLSLILVFMMFSMGFSYATLSCRNRDYQQAAVTQYNVKDYGAIGDGVNDDTDAIQSAVNAASANGGGDVVFPQGTYKVSNIAAKSNVNLLGNGAILVKDGGFSLYSSAIRVAGADTRVKTNIVNNSFKGSSTINVVSAAAFKAGDYIVIRDGTYKYGYYGQNQEFRQIATVDGNAITLTEATIGSYAIAASAEVEKADLIHNITIDGFTIQIPVGTEGCGIYGDYAYNVKVQNCVVSGPQYAGIAFFESAFVNVDHNTVRDGQDVTNFSYGMVFSECHDCIMQNNYAYNIRENMVTNNTRYCSIISNTDEYSYDASFDTHGSGCEFILIENNICKNTRGVGIYVGFNGCNYLDHDITIRGNKLYNIHYVGITTAGTPGLSSYNITIENNEIYNTPYGIRVLNNNSVTARNNLCSNCTDAGILYGNGCNEIILSSNNIAMVSGKAFTYSGSGGISDVAIENNTIGVNNKNSFQGTEIVTGNSWQM